MLLKQWKLIFKSKSPGGGGYSGVLIQSLIAKKTFLLVSKIVRASGTRNLQNNAD